MDRLPRLREQASVWHGTLSVAIYIRPDEQSGAEHAAALDAIRSLYNEVESRQQCRLIISLLYAIDPANAEHEFDTLYPINALRNVAIRQTEARLIMVIDIDFVPSENFWEYLSDESRYSLLVERAETLRHVWALVSLELHEGDYMPLPTTRKQVAAGLATSSLVVAEAYLNPAAHMPVGIQEWLQQDDIYGPLDTAENLSFEPFVLGYGQCQRFWGNRCRHFTVANETCRTRVSLDFRVVPRSCHVERPDDRGFGLGFYTAMDAEGRVVP